MKNEKGINHGGHGGKITEFHGEKSVAGEWLFCELVQFYIGYKFEIRYIIRY